MVFLVNSQGNTHIMEIPHIFDEIVIWRVIKNLENVLKKFLRKNVGVVIPP